MKTCHFKHQYAFNQLGDIVFIDDAEKNVRGEKFYKDKNLKIQFILVNGDIRAKHFREPSKYEIEYNGNFISSNQINENPEHFNFKMQIIKNGFFNIDNYKIYIQNPKDEYVLIGSRYRVDLYAQMLCGKPIAIEIIKTSDLSFSKLNHIEENNITTFKIFIDEYGNQKLEQFDVIGSEEFAILKNKIISEKRNFDFIRTTVGAETRNLENRFKRENDNLQKQYREYIEAKEREVESFKIEQGDSLTEVEYEYRDLQSKIKQVIENLRNNRHRESNRLSIEIKQVIFEIKRIKSDIQ